VRSRNRIDVASKIAGRVTNLPVTEGSRVRRGDLLISLDAPELASAAAQAKAEETSALLAWKTAERQAARYRRLAAGEVVTERDLELVLVAEAAARAGYERAQAGSRMSEQNLAYAELRAPRNARVIRRQVREGDFATPGQPLLVLEDDEDPEVRVTLPAQLDWSLTAGDSASVVLRGDPVSVVVARVDRVTPSADGHTREAFLRAPGLEALSGTFVQVVLYGTPTEVLRVPEAALIHRGSLTGVFRLDGERLGLTWVRLTEDGRVAAGLAPGDRVVLSPAGTLEGGQRVEVAS
jgi:RND family efflux transporter MFP subunit